MKHEREPRQRPGLPARPADKRSHLLSVGRPA
jgi:hypothetical protein